jgi:hypothetical protein
MLVASIVLFTLMKMINAGLRNYSLSWRKQRWSLSGKNGNAPNSGHSLDLLTLTLPGDGANVRVIQIFVIKGSHWLWLRMPPLGDVMFTK